MCLKTLKSLEWLKLIPDQISSSSHMPWSLARLAHAVLSWFVKKLDATIFSAVAARASAMGAVLHIPVIQFPRRASAEEQQVIRVLLCGCNHLARSLHADDACHLDRLISDGLKFQIGQASHIFLFLCECVLACSEGFLRIPKQPLYRISC